MFRPGPGGRLDKFLAAADRLGSRKSRCHRARAGQGVRQRRRGRDSPTRRDVYEPEISSVCGWIRPGSAKRRSGPLRCSASFRSSSKMTLLLVVNKPAGLLSVPLPGRDPTPSVYSLLAEYLRADRHRRLFIVHRIDRDTSGLVVFAKTLPRRRRSKINSGVANRSASIWRSSTDTPRDRPGSGVTCWSGTRATLIQRATHPSDPRGKEAVAEYRVVESLTDTSLIEVRLHTGKRNQIRVQARMRGHTLVGEQRYIVRAGRYSADRLSRQALHAHRLVFQHPVDRRELRFEAPLPEDFADLLKRLRRRV